MVGESGRSSTNGTVYHYYKCSNAKRRKGCHLKALRKDWIERVAVLLTVQTVLTDANIDRIADAILVMQDEEDTLTPALEQQLRECEKCISNLLNAIQAGILTASTKERLEELEARQEELKCAILQARMQRPKYTKDEIVRWISKYKYGSIDDKDYQKEIIDTFLNSIYVFDDRLVLTYNYKDGTDTLSLKDIEAAFGSDLKTGSPPLPQKSYDFWGIFLFSAVFAAKVQNFRKRHSLWTACHPEEKEERHAYRKVGKIRMKARSDGLTLEEAFREFVVSQKAKGSESGLAPNSISSYTRVMKSFLRWCCQRGYADRYQAGNKAKIIENQTVLYCVLGDI